MLRKPGYCTRQTTSSSVPGTYVAKATRAEFVAEREYLLSDRAARMGAPTLPPVMPPVAVGDFTVLVWPRAEPCEEASPGDAARTLVRVQQAWRDFDIDLPRLIDLQMRWYRASTLLPTPAQSRYCMANRMTATSFTQRAVSCSLTSRPRAAVQLSGTRRSFPMMSLPTSGQAWTWA